MHLPPPIDKDTVQARAATSVGSTAITISGKEALRVGLNLLHAVPDIGGGWNYIENLVAALARDDQTTEYVAYANSVSASLVPAAASIRVEIMPIRAGSRAQRVVFEQTALQALAWRDRLHCMHWFANGQALVNASPAVVTVYDMQPFLEYAPRGWATRAYQQWSLRHAVRHAAWILPMSQVTSDALQTMLGADPDRMTVVPPVLDPGYRPPSSEDVRACRDRHGLPAEFWLYVAHLYPHKNHARLLDAYRQLKSGPNPVWPLVLRGDYQGRPLPLAPLIRERGLSEDVITLPRLPREELPALYGAASALVFPSLYEGAGMPVLEAQACGCAVVASDIPPVREFAGDAAHYFNPLDVGDIARAMHAVSSTVRLRQSLRTDALRRAALFRSPNVVDKVKAAYARAARRSSR